MSVTRGVCIDVDHSDLLKEKVEYFLFPAKPSHYYVSRFNRKGAHFGCYPAERFQITEKEVWTPEPQPNLPELNANLFYRAQLIWRKRDIKINHLKITSYSRWGNIAAFGMIGSARNFVVVFRYIGLLILYQFKIII